MRISQRELDRYRAALSARQVEASAYVRARLNDMGLGPGDEGYRTRAVEVMQDCMGVFGDRAQALSARLFDEVCEAEGIDARAVLFDDVIDGGAMAEKIGYYAGATGDDFERYVGKNADLAALYVHKSALENIVRNCDLNNIRFARVATGRETCGFCFMLSSRGFVYANELTAARSSHLHCDCVIVPGQKGRTRIEGYEPEEMRKRWASCYGAIGGDRQLRADWDGLTEAERAGFKGRSEHERWLDYRNKRIQRECETRDVAWLYRNKPSEIGFESMQLELDTRNNRPHEFDMANIFSNNGIPTHFRESSRRFRVRIPDSVVGRRKVEFKAPSGNGRLTIYNQIKSNLYGKDKHVLNPQSNVMAISNVRSEMSLSDMRAGLDLALHGPRGLTPEERAALDEVILVDKNGGLLRVKVNE